MSYTFIVILMWIASLTEITDKKHAVIVSALEYSCASEQHSFNCSVS